MNDPVVAGAFRRKLVERIAFETPYGRRWAIRGPNLELAKMLGVEPAVLDDAAALLRGGALPLDGPPLLARLEFVVPVELSAPFAQIGESLDMGVGQLVRSMMHAVLQTTREPAVRTGGIWRLRGKRVETGVPKARDQKTWAAWCVKVSAGMSEALFLRAHAFGVTRTRYTLLWMADLIDGKLTDLMLDPITPEQTFATQAEYVLPVLERDDPGQRWGRSGKVKRFASSAASIKPASG